MDFKDFYDTYYKDRVISKEKDDLEKELKIWKGFKKLIISETLLPEEFNAANEYYKSEEYLDLSGKNLPLKETGWSFSLRQFVENGSDHVGYLGMMVSGRFPLWIRKEDQKWFVRKSKGVQEEKNKCEGEKFFNNTILHFLKELLEKQSLKEIYEYIDKEKTKAELFPASFLVKLIVLNSLLNDSPYKYKLFGIYKFANIEKEIDAPFKELSKIEGASEVVIALKKSARAVEIFNEKYEIIDKDEVFLKAQRFLWDLGNPDDSTIINELNVIFYGAPGTGKTYAVKKALHSVPEDQKLFVQFHPGFSYEDFIEGIKPTGIDQNGNLTFEIVNGLFKDFCIKAKQSDEPYYFVADEINRANLSAVFGETLSLLESDYRYDANDSEENDCKACLRSTPLSKAITKAILNAEKEKRKEIADKLAFAYDDNTYEVWFGVPKNVHFIGMMNDVDKSIDTFDLALRRRFTWVRKDFDETALEEILIERDINEDALKDYVESCEKLNAYISGCGKSEQKTSLNLGKAFEFGHAFYKDVAISTRGKIIDGAKEALFDKHLAPTLREYCRSFFNETEIDAKIKEAKSVFCKKTSSGE